MHKTTKKSFKTTDLQQLSGAQLQRAGGGFSMTKPVYDWIAASNFKGELITE